MNYIDLKPPLGCLTKQQCNCVKNVIDIVHLNQLVFGDLRQPNILVGPQMWGQIALLSHILKPSLK